MIVVADTSPINYLVQIDEIHLLHDLFGQVLIPQAVFQELQNPKASPKVGLWLADIPEWVQVRSVASASQNPLPELDPGEREAIQLALQLGISIVLIDEAEGRHQARLLHLEVRGTLGILERAARLGKIDFRQTFSKLD